MSREMPTPLSWRRRTLTLPTLRMPYSVPLLFVLLVTFAPLRGNAFVPLLRLHTQSSLRTTRIPFGISSSCKSTRIGQPRYSLPNDIFDIPDHPPQEEEEEEETTSHKSQFLQGDALHRLRRRIYNLKSGLQEARRHHDTDRIEELSAAILAGQAQDGEYMYAWHSRQMQQALQRRDLIQAEVHRHAAGAARDSLPQFQLSGLWVGKYDTTFQLVNITYQGDVLTAYKMTGRDGHVPRGAITFQVDLTPDVLRGSPVLHDEERPQQLEPIQLNEEAMEQWGAQYLQRHAGRGQVAASGYRHAQFIEGQLILVSPYFSFVWLPTGHQVFFGRPSPELTLQLLRETTEVNVREHLERCYQETEFLQMEAAEDELTTMGNSGNMDIASSIPSSLGDGCFE
jgi:Cyclin D1 binding domain